MRDENQLFKILKFVKNNTLLALNLVRIIRNFYIARRDSCAPQSQILFVSKGNICRSPFAEKYLKSVLERRGFDLEIKSVGLKTEHDRLCPENAVDAAISFGIDLKRYRSVLVDNNIINKSSLIICMQFAHYFEIITKFPAAKNRCVLMKHYKNISFNMNIANPYGKDKSVFIKCYREIAECIESFVHTIVKEDSKILKLKIGVT